MSKKIDQNQVMKVAKLSRLDLTEDEVHEFTGQLSAILDYVEKMNELDTTGVEPDAQKGGGLIKAVSGTSYLSKNFS